jgi:hypothetical protein
MCPAVMFAANRNDRVRGRTSTLVDSINTRNGFNQSGAPSGRKCAVDALGLNLNLEIINLSHMGSPRDRVVIKCLVELKEYGVNPARFRRITTINTDVTKEESPFIDRDSVRLSCENIISRVDI